MDMNQVQVLDVSTGCGQIDIIKSMNEAIANDQVALADLNGVSFVSRDEKSD